MDKLSGLRVLELGGFVAAPFAGRWLAQLGAEVIKVESFEGDPTRTIMRGGPGTSFIAFGAEKRSVCIDLASPAGHEVLMRLVETADVVLHNFSPDAARKLHLQKEDLLTRNPKLILCHIRGFGPGPRQDDVATNPMVEAATGIMYNNRVEGRPMRMGPPYLDLFAGVNAVIGILAELASRGRTGACTGAAFDVGLYESALHIASRDLIGVQMEARTEQKALNARGEYALPGYGAYLTADDRWIFLLMLRDVHWQKFSEAMEIPESREESLAKLSGRQSQEARVEKAIRDRVRQFDYDALASRLKTSGVGFSEVVPPAQVFDEPQIKPPGKLVTARYLGHSYEVPGFPMFTGEPPQARQWEVPALGQDTLDVVRSLGYDESECQALLGQRAIHAG